MTKRLKVRLRERCTTGLPALSSCVLMLQLMLPLPPALAQQELHLPQQHETMMKVCEGLQKPSAFDIEDLGGLAMRRRVPELLSIFL